MRTFTDVMFNCWDILNFTLPLISITYYIYNVWHCGCNGTSTNTELCASGKLVDTRESLDRFIFYVKVIAAFNLWAKFFYYAKVVP